MDERWTTLPRSVAEHHPLYGIRGWLIVLVMICVLISFRITVPVNILLRYQFTGTFSNVETALALEVAANAILGLWGIANIFLIFKKHSAFPVSYMALCIAFAIYTAAHTLAVLSLRDPSVSGARLAGQVTGSIMFVIIWSATWVSYVQRSIRVAVTFRNRVPATDPFLATAFNNVF